MGIEQVGEEKGRIRDMQIRKDRKSAGKIKRVTMRQSDQYIYV